MQQSVLREPICGVILIGVDPIAIEPAFLGVLLPSLCWTKPRFLDPVLGQIGHRAGAGAFTLTAEVMSILPPDAI
ncbi:hypothetical protein [Mesorhizobium escarrei]|uniref:hypothetical protein n=1 Tax=Mesorhizobium escarrei TaxID=666018 RepID=UPI0020A71939|nr:hypothetical protein [Mesorhizobium escarrei]